ncbi:MULTISPECIES: FtsX-like permease family protein [unclassified Treponema]|uniref:FtsX-like permease family protein n=1 Tax=unclassified Treponema TaxID=2638727 RepID=UPI0020A50D01|nr:MULTISPECIES: FtsX-like permease family protein [unclassified Treponema]UTC67119.1 ABC transporter permease [Treponema sp. OMZ 789]UTC69850.1 ABC transporter permease [Treponema sp. OMZ 790]UTC72564.1 ABC transporter permease [Treponema sp. OMZ 791]
MKLNFYFQLAKKNISTGAKTYIPYIFACSLSIMMFSIMYTLSKDAFTQKLGGLKALMEFGVIIVGFFSMIFIFYGNKFLIKNRVKEIGLYTILGLEKKHIAGVLFFEFLACYFLSMLFGAIGSMLFGKLCFLILFKLSGIPSKINYSLSLTFLKPASIVFFCFFIINYLYNLKKISLLNPIQFLTESKSGEKRSKYLRLKTFLALFFAGAGYVLSILSFNPITALKNFLPAVILVIAGTFFLFESITVFILNKMKKRKSYYKPAKFISVSGMIYRMGQHAKGLASICILLTMILLSLASVSSIYMASRKIVSKSFVRNHLLDRVFNKTDAELQNKEKVIADIKEIGAEHKIETNDFLYVRYFHGIVNMSANIFYENADSYFSRTGVQLVLCSFDDIKNIFPKDLYKKLTEIGTRMGDDEVFIFCNDNQIDYTRPLQIGKRSVKPKKLEAEFVSVIKNYPYVPYSPLPHINIIVKDAAKLDLIKNELNIVKENARGGFKNKKTLALAESFFWNTSADNLSIPASYSKALQELAKSLDAGLVYSDKFLAYKERREFDGTFLFLGAFLSLMFLIWLILIMYFKQISEGLEDRRRWQIMLKIGMDSSLIKKTSHAQLVWLFVLPVLVSLVHCFFASPLFTQLLFAFGLFNKIVFFAALFLSGGFTLILYLVFYKITSSKYNKIIG